MYNSVKTVKVCLIFAGIVAILATFNMHNIYAMYWRAENATVFLKNCKLNCELKGTLAVLPFDGRYYIENENGTTYLEPGSYTKIEYPLSQP